MDNNIFLKYAARESIKSDDFRASLYALMASEPMDLDKRAALSWNPARLIGVARRAGNLQKTLSGVGKASPFKWLKPKTVSSGMWKPTAAVEQVAKNPTALTQPFKPTVTDMNLFNAVMNRPDLAPFSKPFVPTKVKVPTTPKVKLDSVLKDHQKGLRNLLKIVEDPAFQTPEAQKWLLSIHNDPKLTSITADDVKNSLKAVQGGRYSGYEPFNLLRYHSVPILNARKAGIVPLNTWGPQQWERYKDLTTRMFIGDKLTKDLVKDPLKLNYAENIANRYGDIEKFAPNVPWLKSLLPAKTPARQNLVDLLSTVKRQKLPTTYNELVKNLNSGDVVKANRLSRRVNRANGWKQRAVKDQGRKYRDAIKANERRYHAAMEEKFTSSQKGLEDRISARSNPDIWYNTPVAGITEEQGPLLTDILTAREKPVLDTNRTSLLNALIDTDKQKRDLGRLRRHLGRMDKAKRRAEEAATGRLTAKPVRTPTYMDALEQVRNKPVDKKVPRKPRDFDKPVQTPVETKPIVKPKPVVKPKPDTPPQSPKPVVKPKPDTPPADKPRQQKKKKKQTRNRNRDRWLQIFRSLSNKKKKAPKGRKLPKDTDIDIMPYAITGGAGLGTAWNLNKKDEE